MASSRALCGPMQCIRFLSNVCYGIEHSCFRNFLVTFELFFSLSQFCHLFSLFSVKLGQVSFINGDFFSFAAVLFVNNDSLVLVLRVFIQNFLNFFAQLPIFAVLFRFYG